MSFRAITAFVDIARHHYHGVERASNDLDLHQKGTVTLGAVARSLVLPAAAGGAMWAWAPASVSSVGVGFSVFAGITAGYFFQLGVQMIARSQEHMSSDSRPSIEKDRYTVLLHDLGASSAFAAIISLVSALMSGALLLLECGWPRRLLFSLCTFLLIYLVQTSWLLIIRAFRLTRGNLFAQTKAQ